MERIIGIFLESIIGKFVGMGYFNAGASMEEFDPENCIPHARMQTNVIRVGRIQCRAGTALA